MHQFDIIGQDLLDLIAIWELKLQDLSTPVLNDRKNRQNRTIRQIVGHLIDSASNNLHRTIHLQYQPVPLLFPDYANYGANDKWISIQKYRDEDWHVLVSLWKYLNIHFVHVIRNVDPGALQNIWISALGEKITLQAMIVDYPRHFRLHLAEIQDLIDRC